jgi:arylsulfatase A-like enzyme
MNNKNTTLLLSGLTLLSTNLSAQNKNQRPNIIHIMTDDHAFQAISAYGHPLSKLVPTPNIDRLAKEGIIFQKAFVENSISAPSRATLLTGKYSHVHGQMRLGGGLKDSIPVFTEALQQNGYQTALIGKWHLNNDPKGFDFYKILHEQGDYYNPEFRTSETNGKYIREEGYATTLITDHAIEWMQARNKDKPFCLLLHHKAPHRNWMPEEKYLNAFKNIEFPYPSTLFDDYSGRSKAAKTQEMSILPDMSMSYDLKVDQLKDEEKTDWEKRDWEKAMTRMTPAQKKAWDEAYNDENESFVKANLHGEELLKWKYQRYIKDYLRCIKSVDDQVGRVIKWLEAEGILDNTIIVYTSDQGFYLGEHGWFDKRFMYEESFRTPLIIRYPKLIKKGVQSQALVQNIDYAATYLNVANITVPQDYQGKSLVPLFKGITPTDWRKELYYQYYDYPAVHSVRKHYGIRTDRYKLIHFYGQGKGKDNGINLNDWEFYDLKKDKNEMHNLYGVAKYAKIITDLKVRLDKKRAEIKTIE